MKISIVTVCRNAEVSLSSTIESVKSQTYGDIEHVFVDGASTDRTVDLIKSSRPAAFISEPDSGIYDAMQKGITLTTGDALFFLNSGDIFCDERVVADVVTFFKLTKADAVFGNLWVGDHTEGHDHPVYRPGQLIDLGYFSNRQMFFDESIHHQTIFYSRKIFDRCGYLCDEPAANGEYYLNMCAFVREGFVVKHLPRGITRFALGGYSTSNFAAEWARFSAARDILRRRFFPQGPGGGSSTEYLYYPPSFANRIKILVRNPRVRTLLDYGRRVRRPWRARCQP
ncbi:glycosyltransferase family 2 protein [Mesorhizobium sp.]|uniref:glycosyltransferase family 2 protein n=1 Tax=Mesorhizobium sp. TaxID=1871066 RepID=UPI000FE9E9EC|nr:glycosyltransferase family 2 protein [Mesorhizobium sp.]RWB56738.1 MAG: glycosyltransferase [Mesorhizobium sp.]